MKYTSQTTNMGITQNNLNTGVKSKQLDDDLDGRNIIPNNTRVKMIGITIKLMVIVIYRFPVHTY
jgi:hypothetical protein